MKTKMLSFVVLLILAFFHTLIQADDHALTLSSYEPNTVTWVKDSNDVNYMDFKVSLKYPLTIHNEYCDAIKSESLSQLNLYFAFTTRFAQYLKTRDSSPVVGKQFAPRIFNRFWLGDKEQYLDLGYVHESNGQDVNDFSEYLALRQQYLVGNENPDFANDYISRGWDYVEMRVKHGKLYNEGKLSAYLMLRHYLRDGFAQGEPEEIRDWERPGEIPLKRKDIDGLHVLTKYQLDQCHGGWLTLCDGKLALSYTTGIARPFEHHSYRAELTFVVAGTLPLTFWYAYGHQSDLIDYDKRVESFGLGVEFI